MKKERVNIQIRTQVNADSVLGKTIQYLHARDYNFKQEFEVFLRAKYLPFVLYQAGDIEGAIEAAHHGIGHLMGMVETIRSLGLSNSQGMTGKSHTQSPFESMGENHSTPNAPSSPSPPINNDNGSNGHHPIDARMDAAGKLFGV